MSFRRWTLFCYFIRCKIRRSTQKTCSPRWGCFSFPFILLFSRGGQTFILMKDDHFVFWTCLRRSGGRVLDSFTWWAGLPQQGSRVWIQRKQMFLLWAWNEFVVVNGEPFIKINAFLCLPVFQPQEATADNRDTLSNWKNKNNVIAILPYL